MVNKVKGNMFLICTSVAGKVGKEGTINPKSLHYMEMGYGRLYGMTLLQWLQHLYTFFIPKFE